MFDLRIVERSAEGLGEVAAFLRSAFPRGGHLSAEYLDWMYCQNPDGEAVAVNAYDGKELIGHVAFVCGRSRVLGRDESCVLGVNAATAPGKRRQGLFKALFGRCCEIAVEQSYTLLLTTANATSMLALETVGFQNLGLLDVRVGAGPTPRRRPVQDLELDRIWTRKALLWRLSRPGAVYRFRRRGDLARIYANSGIAGMRVDLGDFPAGDVGDAIPELEVWNTLRVWIGLDPGRRWGLHPYFNLPVRLRPSPLCLGVLDLTSAERRFHREQVRVDGLDLDLY